MKKADPLIVELRRVQSELRTTRAKALAVLRDLSNHEIAMLDPGTDRWGENNLQRKIFYYPGDLSIVQLIRLIERKNELGL